MKKKDNILVTTIIGKETLVKGIISSQESIRIEGQFEGEINALEEVQITENSKIKASIKAKKAIVDGEIIGNIEVVEGLEISKTGRVFGNIQADRLLIEEGAIYRGKVDTKVIDSSNDYEGNTKFNNLK